MTSAYFFLATPAVRRRFLVIVGLYIVAWLTTWYMAGLLTQSDSVSLWFLPIGLRYFCLLVFGLPGIFVELATHLCFWITQFVLSPQLTWRAALFESVYQEIASFIVFLLVIVPVRRWRPIPWDFTQAGSTAWLMGSALVLSALEALAGSFRLLYTGVIARPEWPDAFVNWMLGDFVGIVTLVPMLLVRVWPRIQHYIERGDRFQLASGHRSSGAADRNTALAMLLSLVLVFGIPWYLGLKAHFPLMALLLLLPLVTVTTLYGLRSALLAALMLDTGLVILMALNGLASQAFQYQVVMIAIAAVGLWLGGAVDARDRLMVRYRDFASVSNDLLWESDAKGVLVQAHGGLADHDVSLLGHAWPALLGDKTDPEQRRALEAALAHQQPFRHLEIELAPREEGGDPSWVRLSGLPLVDETGRVNGFRGTAIDITQQVLASALIRDYNQTLIQAVAERTAQLEQANGVLAELSNTDALTGLANRRRFDAFFAHEWARALRNRAPIAVLLFDIDYFKKYNDHYGHQAGDSCLQAVAAALKESVRRPGELAARYGGEEFVIVVADAQGDDALRLAELVRHSVEALAMEHAPSTHGVVTISGGVAVAIPDGSMAMESLLHNADEALYRAKAQGRNMVHHHELHAVISPAGNGNNAYGS